MAASKSFAFEERAFSADANAPLAPGSVPDFEAVSILSAHPMCRISSHASYVAASAPIQHSVAHLPVRTVLRVGAGTCSVRIYVAL